MTMMLVTNVALAIMFVLWMAARRVIRALRRRLVYTTESRDYFYAERNRLSEKLDDVRDNAKRDVAKYQKFASVCLAALQAAESDLKDARQDAVEREETREELVEKLSDATSKIAVLQRNNTKNANKGGKKSCK